MNFKRILKNSPFFSLLLYTRYLIKRYLINRAFDSFKLANDIEIEAVDSDGVTFFGYYNISPENQNGDILYLKVNNEIIRGSLFEPASIMLKHADGHRVKLALTKSWNWQQGCMLQWFPGKADHILFNDYDTENDKYITKVIDIEGNILKTFDKPVNNVSKTGQFALSLNYDRLAKMRPDYGYFNRGNIDLPTDSEDGIWYIDLNSSEIKLIISLDKLKNLAWSSTMEGALHKVNHIDINPPGTRIMFLHRWKGPNGRFMRLITADPNGSELFILNGDIMTSHCCWLNDEEILSYCEFNGVRGYFKFSDKSENAQLLSTQMPKIDGHPSISKITHKILTDTYPAKDRFSKLFLYDIRNDLLEKMGNFYQPFKYNKEMRIDLHPKWSNFSNSIYFESGHKNKRQFFKLIKIQ